jgi:hypothetical protein
MRLTTSLRLAAVSVLAAAVTTSVMAQPAAGRVTTRSTTGPRGTATSTSTTTRTETGATRNTVTTGVNGKVYTTDGTLTKTETGRERSSTTVNEQGKTVRAVEGSVARSNGTTERTRAVTSPRGETRHRNSSTTRP